MNVIFDEAFWNLRQEQTPILLLAIATYIFACIYEKGRELRKD